MPDRLRVSSGSVWEPIAGYSRAIRVKDTIRVSGTTATHGGDRCVAPGDPGAQTTYILDKIAASITALGGGWRTWSAPASISGRREMGAGLARAWPRVRRDHAGQHDGAGRRSDRRLRGRDRGRGGGAGRASVQRSEAKAAWQAKPRPAANIGPPLWAGKAIAVDHHQVDVAGALRDAFGEQSRRPPPPSRRAGARRSPRLR